MSNLEHCGSYSIETIELALSKTRMIESNKRAMIDYFVNGVRLKDLPISKQAATSRIKVILEKINANS